MSEKIQTNETVLTSQAEEVQINSMTRGKPKKQAGGFGLKKNEGSDHKADNKNKEEKHPFTKKEKAAEHVKEKTAKPRKEKSAEPVKEKTEKSAKLLKEKTAKPRKEKSAEPAKGKPATSWKGKVVESGRKATKLMKEKVGPFFAKLGKGIASFFCRIGKALAPVLTWIGRKLSPLWKKLMEILADTTSTSVFSIRNKLLFGFLVPILFMIIIGVVAYGKAKDGMGKKFADSTVQTIQMVRENVDSSCEFVKAAGNSFMLSTELKDVLSGRYKSKPVEESTLLTKFRTDLTGYQSGNKFISNMHIIPKETYRILSTATTEVRDGILDAYRSDVMEATGTFTNWVDLHKVLDETIDMESTDYIMSYQVMSSSNFSCIVADISPDAIMDLLDILDLGDGSVVGFVTARGRELIRSQNKKISAKDGNAVFFGQDFFVKAQEASELNGVIEKVRYKGQSCMFFYSRSELTGATVCALVPINTITEQAQDIKIVAVVMVIIAVLVVVGISIAIIAGIQSNMKKISVGFGEVAEGDLTVEVKVNGKDEFYSLAGSANHMVHNTKKLVGKVNAATTHLEESAKNVKDVSETISGYSYDISKIVDGINQDMDNQASHARECVERTNVLSREIQEMNSIIGNIESGIQETELMIGRGVEKVQTLGEHAKQTTDITLEVSESIENLKTETAVINKFVAMITDISSQTNLLSLNASIEAARAGEAGRGFSVVASEIRKLADDSARAAGEIKSNVGHIIGKAQDSVESAGRAQEMVASQTEVVGQVIEIFKEMSQQMASLMVSLKEVMEHTEKTDAERERTIGSVNNISGIISDTAENTGAVTEAISRLMTSVQNLNEISKVLNDNMNELKGEISSFKTE